MMCFKKLTIFKTCKKFYTKRHIKFSAGGIVPRPEDHILPAWFWVNEPLGEPWQPGERVYSKEVFNILYGSGRAVRKMEVNKNETGGKYLKTIILKSDAKGYKGIVYGLVDVYAVLEAFGVTCPAVAHAVKKLLCPGERGTKDKRQDIKESKDCILRAFDMEEARLDLAEALENAGDD